MLFLLTAWAATAAGRTILRGLGLSDAAIALECNLLGFALGLGLLAYAMLALGLLGGLYPIFGWLLLGALAGIGARSHSMMAREIGDIVRNGVRLTPWEWGLAFLFALLAGVALVGVWTPPTLNLEWDTLSYHLADPKIYLLAHRISYLPWESHSNFAFTAEMWYLFGLMMRGPESGIPLAKLFHFSCGAGACLAIYALGARHVSPRVGQIAALLFASTPLALWEAGTAYADLAPTFFTTLTLLAVGNGIAGRDERWLRLGAVLMGLTLSTKATSLTTLALLVLCLLIWRLRSLAQSPVKAVGSMAVWCVLALTVGSPWLIKSTVYTGNPVYPFYSQIFGGRYWNVDLGKQYDASNANFGVGTSLAEVHSSAQAILVPWNLTMYLVPGHLFPNNAFRPFNDNQTPLASLSPVLLVALFFPAFRRGQAVPASVKVLGIFALLSGLLWFATMQYARYLLPLVPVLCLLATWVLAQAVSVRSLSGYALAVLGICSLAWTGYIGASLLTLEAPVAFGLQSRAAYLTQHEPTYPTMQFINTQLPAHSKLVFYGNPLGFYCDRPYLWGDAQHSTFIPYAKFQTAEDLRVYLQKLGVTYILVNHLYFSSDPSATDYSRWVYALTDGSSPPLFEAHGVAVYALPAGKG